MRSTVVSVVRRNDSQTASATAATSPDDASPPSRTRSTIQVVSAADDPDEKKLEVSDIVTRDAKGRDTSDRRKKNESRSPERKESDDKSPKRKRR